MSRVATSLKAVVAAVLGDAIAASVDDVKVTGATLDSRAVTSGDLFCCVRGGHVDGHHARRTIDWRW